MNEDLAASWSRTGLHLDDAVAAIEDVPGSSLTEYKEFRTRNELGLALDVLVALAEERQVGLGCWVALRRAAQEMELDARDSIHGRSVMSIMKNVQPPQK